jgi:hypothetical protein
MEICLEILSMALFKFGHYNTNSYIDVLRTKCCRLNFCYIVAGDIDYSRLKNKLKSPIFLFGCNAYVAGANGYLFTVSFLLPFVLFVLLLLSGFFFYLPMPPIFNN